NEQEAEFYQMTLDYLNEHGFTAYEISNFSRDEKWQCRHNLKYWDHHPFLGLGPSAHSFVSPKRWWNKKSIAAYVKKVSAGSIPVEREESLSPESLEFEYIFLHLRLRDGLRFADFQERFNHDFLQKYDEALQKLADNEMIIQDDRRMRLSAKGWLFADEVSSYF
ncbi:MAG: hypothetical protein ACK2TU_04975, partial [Anaerolineales bacterium]